MAKFTVKFDLPDREPDEPDITGEQFIENKSHETCLDNAFLRNLGRYQAAVLIRKIEENKRNLFFFGMTGKPGRSHRS